MGRDQLEIDLDRQLGSGAFATVYAGKLNGKRPVDGIQPSARFGIPRTELVIGRNCCEATVSVLDCREEGAPPRR